MEIIKKDVTNEIRENSKAQNRLLYEFDITINTLKRWMDENDKGEATLLTTPMGLRAISDELSLKKSELMCEFEMQ